ncbi:MAG: hypothetical protein WB383_05930, partial [Acidimicrobiales bacterium]
MPFNENAEQRGVLMRAALGRSLPFWSGVLDLQEEKIRGLLGELQAVRDEVRTFALAGRLFNSWSLRCNAEAHFVLVAT